MIVGLFKNKLQVSLTSFLVISFILFIYSFGINTTLSESYTVNDSLFYPFINNTLNYSPIITKISNTLLLLIGAFIISAITINNEITSKDNYLPSFFYLIFGYSATSSNELQPILIATILILYSLSFLFKSYRNDNAIAILFNAGFLISLAGGIYSYFIFLIPIGFIAVLVLKSLYWKDWVSYLAGVITPIYLYSCLSYLLIGDFYKPFQLLQITLTTVNFPIVSEYYILFIIVTLFLFLLSLFYYLRKGFGGRVKIKKIKFVILWLSVHCFLISLIHTTSHYFLLPCIAPFSIVLGDYLGEIKQLKVANTLLTLFIASFIIICLHNLNFI